MLFTGLARAIIRHNRAVFAIWLAALALSIPAILQVQSVIVYNETAFNPKNSESSMALDLVGKEFSIDQGTSAIVVITSNDVRGNDVRDFTLALNRTLDNDGKLSNINNITSIYDIYYQLLVSYTSIVHLQLYQTKNATTLAANIEFGIPSVYVNDWVSQISSAPSNITQAQLAAYNLQAYNDSWPIVSAQTPSGYQTVAFDYLKLFYQSWNQTFTAQNYTQSELLFSSPPFARAQNVTKGSPLLTTQPSYYNITIPFVQSLPLDSQTLSLFVSAARFFNVYGQFVSAHNNTMLVIIDFKSGGPDPMNSIPAIRQDVGIANTASNENLTVYVTGEPAFNYDIQTQTVTDIERIDPVTVTLILVIVGIFFTSIVAPLIPIIAIGLSIGIAFGLVFAVGSVITRVHYLVLTLLPVSMLGAGSDYCIFLVSRYSEERRMGRGKDDSVE